MSLWRLPAACLTTTKPGKACPAAEKTQTSNRRDGPQPTQARDAEQVEAAGEQHNTRCKQARRNPEKLLRGILSRKQAVAKQRQRMEQVVLHARLINPHSLVIYDRSRA